MDYQLERNAGIFDPTLDPTNEETYVVLEAIFKELSEIFTFNYVHIGGDENEGKHWDKNPKIQQFKKDNNLKTNHDFFHVLNPIYATSVSVAYTT